MRSPAGEMKMGGIIFDLDDTLIKFDAVSLPSWHKAVAPYIESGDGLDSLRLVSEIRQYGQWYYSDSERHREGRHNLHATRRRIVRAAFDVLDIDDTGSADTIADRYSTIRSEMIEPFPGIYDTLNAIRTAEIPMLLVTNGEAVSQREKIDRFELAGFFKWILIEGELGYGKPDERIFDQIEDLFEASGSQLTIVGDNLEWEIEVPSGRGYCTVWHDWRGAGLPADSTARPDHIIGSIPELLHIVGIEPSEGDAADPGEL